MLLLLFFFEIERRLLRVKRFDLFFIGKTYEAPGEPFFATQVPGLLILRLKNFVHAFGRLLRHFECLCDFVSAFLVFQGHAVSRVVECQKLWLFKLDLCVVHRRLEVDLLLDRHDRGYRINHQHLLLDDLAGGVERARPTISLLVVWYLPSIEFFHLAKFKSLQVKLLADIFLRFDSGRVQIVEVILRIALFLGRRVISRTLWKINPDVQGC